MRLWLQKRVNTCFVVGCLAWCCAAILSFEATHLAAQQAESGSQMIPTEGLVVNAQTGEPVASASVRLQGANRGTYTDKNGKFRLPLAEGEHTLLVRSLGYQVLEIKVSVVSNLAPMRIELVPSTVQLGAVNVIAEVSATEIVRRAIANKEANRQKVRTSSGLVYSKMTAQVDAPTLFLSAEQKARVEQLKNLQIETFSRVEKQYVPTPYTRRTIVQRRQTANIKAAENLFVLDEFLDFFDAELTLAGTRFTTPLGVSAPNFYEYTLLERKEFGSRTVYVIAFKPFSSVFPGFEGTVHIIEGSYAVLQLSAKPTKTTAMQFVNELSFYQKFDRFNNKLSSGEEAEVWLPTLLEVSVGLRIEALKWLAEIGLTLKARSIMSEVDVNPAFPDAYMPTTTSGTAAPRTTSVRVSTTPFRRRANQSTQTNRPETSPVLRSSTQATVGSTGSTVVSSTLTTSVTSGSVVMRSNETSVLSVMQDADSAKPEFWEQNALAELTTEEREMYTRIDSVVKASPPDTNRTEARVNPFSIFEVRLSTTAVLNFDPVLDRSRVTGLLYGASAQVQWDPSDAFGALFLVSAGTDIEYGKSVGTVGLKLDLWRTDKAVVSLAGDVFSQLGTLQYRPLFGARFSGINAGNVLYAQQFDFYRKDGFSAALLSTFDTWDIAFGWRRNRVINMPTVVPNERENVAALAGDFSTVQGELSWNLPPGNEMFTLLSAVNGGKTSIGGRLVGRVGQELRSAVDFYSVEGQVYWTQPTFFTGYTPMFLQMRINAGYASSTAPVQEQFTAVRRFGFGGRNTDFATIPVNGLSGTEYVSLHLEHNFSDVLWRLIGLPTWKERGLEFIFLAQTGKYNQRGTAAVFSAAQNRAFGEQSFAPTNNWHTEIGVGISRIPSFISDFFYFRFDALWGLGNNIAPNNNFGYSVSFTFPF